MPYENTLAPVLREIVARWEILGLAVGIVHDGEIVYAQGFGVQSLDTRTPVTPDSLFCVASISKVFVATAVMQLAERGKLDLDAPLVCYLPYFVLDDERYSQITLRHILSHTSGLPDWDEFEYDDLVAHPEFDDGAAERFVRGLRNRRLVAAPGERFLYSNIAYSVLGDMLAQVTGRPFEAAMREHILLPAGMPSSTFLLREVPRDRLAVPHLRAPEMIVNPIYPYHRADAPASWLHSNVLDMCHWAIMCMNRGRWGDQAILSQAGLDRMWSPVIKRGLPPLYDEMGLGWNLGNYLGAKTISHGGMGFGWTDFLVILPEKKQAAVILSVDESSSIYRIRQAVLDAMLGQSPQVGPVSWMVPVSQALREGGQAGGIEAAYARCAALKAGAPEDVYFDADELLTLALHLMTVKKFDLEIEVLKLNLYAFPDHVDSRVYLAHAYLQTGQFEQAEAGLLQALSSDPHHAVAARLLAQARAGISGRTGAA